MTYIHLGPDWPRFSWDDAALAEPVGVLHHELGRHLGRMESLGFDLRGEACLAVLTTDLVKSWAIEGETLNAAEVRSSLARRLGLDSGGLPEAGREVEGIVEMMLDATQDSGTPLTSERLFAWHAALFPTGRSGLGRITVGAWRPESAGPMQVVSGPIGRERVHFEAPPADRLDYEMTAFLDWFGSRPHIDPILRAGTAHLWFLTIHPFEDGNGRIARAIADMALSQADGMKDRYYSLSTQIEAERKSYYLQLEAAQRGTLDLTEWLNWFVGCLGRAVGTAEETLASVLHAAAVWQRVSHHAVNDRQRSVISRLLDGFKGFLSTSKYAKLAKCSQDTALRDVRLLVEWGILVQNPGGGRSSSYRLVETGNAPD